ncbi:MAG: histidine kinase [Candidatus Acidiferrales bacterium]
MAQTRRGHLKMYLGYAAGVGKTYTMLEEALELKHQGMDVVVGYFEPHGRKDTIAKVVGLELIARRKMQYKTATFEEMDTDAILQRHPQVCIVDEFAHTNVPGSERTKRWQDVQILLDAGIDVLTTMNVQHLESLNDQIWQITGVRVRETVPDWVVQEAEEVIMTDLTPRALLNRLERGVIYAPDKARRAMENFFRESNLVALREMALRQTAHEVEVRQSTQEAVEDALRKLAPGDPVSTVQAAAKERILIYVTPAPASAALIRRGRRVAEYLHADCFAVYVDSEEDSKRVSTPEHEALEKHLSFARNLHIETRVLQGQDVAEVLVDFARQQGVTQIFVMRTRANGWPHILGRDLLRQIVHLARDMQVTIVAERSRGAKL